jgi:hypothetical protein
VRSVNNGYLGKETYSRQPNLNLLFLFSSVEDPGSMPLWPLDPGYEIQNRFFLDHGSRIPNPYLLKLNDNFLGRKFFNSLYTGPKFFLHMFENKIIYNFVIFVATTKKGRTTKFFHPSL